MLDPASSFFWCSLMLTPTLPDFLTFLAVENLDGWLLFDFKRRNPIAAVVVVIWIAGSDRVPVLTTRKGITHVLVHEFDSELRQQGVHDKLISGGAR